MSIIRISKFTLGPRSIVLPNPEYGRYSKNLYRSDIGIPISTRYNSKGIGRILGRNQNPEYGRYSKNPYRSDIGIPILARYNLKSIGRILYRYQNPEYDRFSKKSISVRYWNFNIARYNLKSIGRILGCNRNPEYCRFSKNQFKKHRTDSGPLAKSVMRPILIKSIPVRYWNSNIDLMHISDIRP